MSRFLAPAIVMVFALQACGGGATEHHQAAAAGRGRQAAPVSPATSPSGGPAYKGLTDNPAYQWWEDPANPQPDSWWGAGQTDASLQAQAALMRQLGAVMFRVELPWSFVAPTEPGETSYETEVARNPDWAGYSWARWDEIVRVATRNRLVVVPEVVYTPGWASGVAASARGGPNAPPRSATYFADFMHALVTRYHSEIHYWELGNEPDYAPHSWLAGLAAYVSLILQPGYQAVKSVDPSAEVVMGGLAGDASMSALEQAGASPYFDIANFHAYYAASQGDATALDHVQAALRSAGDGAKPIWLTEFGMQTAASSPPAGSPDPAAASGEAKQATLIRDVFGGLGSRVQAIFLYQLHDTAVYTAPGTMSKRVFWGIVNGDLTRKKAGFEAFQSMPGAVFRWPPARTRPSSSA